MEAPSAACPRCSAINSSTARKCTACAGPINRKRKGTETAATPAHAPIVPTNPAPSAPVPPDRIRCTGIPRLTEQLAASLSPRICCAEGVLPRQRTNWDCGYANLGALLCTLDSRGELPASATSLVSPIRAGNGIAKIQGLIERSWREGFDQGSARQYRFSLANKSGRAGWIGAPEAYALLLHLRLDSFIIEVVDRRASGAVVYAVALEYFKAASQSESGQEQEQCSSYAMQRYKLPYCTYLPTYLPS